MIVVSDTSPVTALLTVGEADLLPALFTEVAIPEAVRSELLRSHPSLPAWLRTTPIKDRHRVTRTPGKSILAKLRRLRWLEN